MSELNGLIEKLVAAEATKAEYEDQVRNQTMDAQKIIDATVAEYEPILSTLDQNITELRAMIRNLMMDTGDEKKRHAGKVVNLVRRPKLAVTDVTAAREWLTEQGQLAAFITLNTDKYIKAYPDGPGISKKFTTFITVGEDRVSG